MKYALFFIALFLFAHCTPQENPQQVSLTSIPATTANIQFDIPTSIARTVTVTKTEEDYIETRTDTISLDETGRGSWSVEIDRPQYISLVAGYKRRTFFLGEGGNMTIQLDSTGSVFSYKGSNTQENKYLEELWHNETLRKHSWSSGDKVSLDSFRRKLEIYYSAKKLLLDSFFPGPEEKQAPFYQFRIMDQKAFRNYGLLKFIGANFEEKAYDEQLLVHFDKDFLNYEQMIPFLEVDNVRWMYDRYVPEYLAIKKYGAKWRDRRSATGNSALCLEVIEDEYPNPIKRFVVFYRLRGLAAIHSDRYPDHLTPIPVLMSNYGYVLGEGKVKELEAILRQRVKKSRVYEKGEEMPSFILKNKNGTDVEIGKNDSIPVLYDVWSSWCGPCIKSFPQVKEIEKKYAGRLKVISISLDEKQENYLKALEKLDVPGSLHLWAPGAFKSDFAQFFQIVAIPNYLLIDGKGKIVAFDHLGVVSRALEGIEKIEGTNQK